MYLFQRIYFEVAFPSISICHVSINELKYVSKRKLVILKQWQKEVGSFLISWMRYCLNKNLTVTNVVDKT